MSFSGASISRFALRYPQCIPLLLALGWIVLVAGAVLRLWRPRADWLLLLFLTIVAGVLANAWVRWRRERLIRESELPQFLKRKLRETYPHLSQKDAELVERGLRQFFLACLRSRGKFVAMPSRVVDAMWHEFILHTQAYRDWCALALGHFLHHTPAEVLGGNARANDGLRRAWWWACKDEAIDPRQPTRLPLLFALDAKLDIPNGFHYVPDCGGVARRDEGAGGGCGGATAHCATSFGDDSAGGGDATGFGGSDGSGDGGGCGGGGD